MPIAKSKEEYFHDFYLVPNKPFLKFGNLCFTAVPGKRLHCRTTMDTYGHVKHLTIIFDENTKMEECNAS